MSERGAVYYQARAEAYAADWGTPVYVPPVLEAGRIAIRSDGLDGRPFSSHVVSRFCEYLNPVEYFLKLGVPLTQSLEGHAISEAERVRLSGLPPDPHPPSLAAYAYKHIRRLVRETSTPDVDEYILEALSHEELPPAILSARSRYRQWVDTPAYHLSQAYLLLRPIATYRKLPGWLTVMQMTYAPERYRRPESVTPRYFGTIATRPTLLAIDRFKADKAKDPA